MKKVSFPVTSVLVVIGCVILINSCKVNHDKNDYLRKVLANLEQIKSATYFSRISFTPPGDTSVLKTYFWHKREYFNQSDTTVGSVFWAMKKEQQIRRSEMLLKYHYRAGIDNDALPLQWVDL